MKKATKLADVAKAAGVSIGTASNAFNRPEIVRDEILERVRRTAREIGYSGPDAKARVLRAGKVNAVGMATGERLSYFFEDPFARVLMAGVAEACDAAGAGLALVSAINRDQIAWNVESALVDGFILHCIQGGPELVRLATRRGLPFVAVNWLDDPGIAALGIDDRDGARKAARHLLELGHRRFAIIALETDPERATTTIRSELGTHGFHVTRDRLEGYFEVLLAAGIEADSVPIIRGYDSGDAIGEELADLFARPSPPTAILAMSDRFAIIALHWLAERGYGVPGEVSVVGFDGVPESELATPPLTTIAQPIKELGRLSVKAVLEGVETKQRRVLDTDLVVRGSTGPPPVV